MNKSNEPRSPKTPEKSSGQVQKDGASGNSHQYRTNQGPQKQNAPQPGAKGERQEKKLAQGEVQGSSEKSKNS